MSANMTCPDCGHSRSEGCGCSPDVRAKRVAMNAINDGPMSLPVLVDLVAAMVQMEKRQAVACVWDLISDGVFDYDIRGKVQHHAAPKPLRGGSRTTQHLALTPCEAAALSRLVDAYTATDESDPGLRDLLSVQRKVDHLTHDHGWYTPEYDDEENP